MGVVTPFSVTSTVRAAGSTGAGSSCTRHGFPWRIAELTAASAADSCSFDVARKNCSLQSVGLLSWKQEVSLGLHSPPPAAQRRWKSPASANLLQRPLGRGTEHVAVPDDDRLHPAWPGCSRPCVRSR